ncbi:MAG: serine/threonine protein phosphatase [Candidatus Bathyarchaeota archaeon]|nr:serine/threonine protein phosphatase [Candidatus Bathyarchaeota archaeon]
MERLVEKSLAELSQGYLKLIKTCIVLLKKERTSKLLNITGNAIMLPSSGKIIIIGDLHGDLKSLVKILNQSRFLERVANGENIRLVFLGDYGDRGDSSPEVYHIILELKTTLPQYVILLRGNHEGVAGLLPSPHDLPDQLVKKYDHNGLKIYKQLLRLFDFLYTTVLVEQNVALVHVGLPSNAKSFEDIAFASTTNCYLEEILLSDPKEDIQGTRRSIRGAGRFFGSDVTERILKILRVNFIIRGHEPCIRGFKTNHNGRILTVFSNKCYYKKACYVELNLNEKLGAKELMNSIEQF